MGFLVFLAGGLLLAALVRAWRPGLSRRAAAGYLLLTVAFFAAPLSRAALQVPTDIAYQWRPWAEQVEGRVVPRNGLLADVPLQMLPFRTLVRERLLHGVPPLWANEMGAGQPLLGNAQSAPFAPLHLLALPLPPLLGMTVATAWQVLLALLLLHGLLLALGADPAGAVFGATAYAFSAYSIVWAYYPLGMAAAWVPGVLLGLILLRREERGAVAGLVACGTSLALSGHPETLAYTVLPSAALVGGLLLEARPGRGRFLARLLGAGALAGCLAAPALLPFLEQMPASERMAVIAAHPQGVAPAPFEPRILRSLVDPLVFGSPRDRNWSGPSNFNETCSGYAGLLALALGLAGLAGTGAGRWRALAGGLAALLAALRVPPFYAAVQALPGLSHGAPGRLRLFWVLAVAVAAGLQLTRLGETSRTRAAAIVALAAAAVALFVLPPPDVPWQRAWWVATLAGIALTLLALVSRPLRGWLPQIALAGLALDLLLLGIHYQPILPLRFDLAPSPAVAYLMAARERSPAPFRVVAEGFDLMPNLAAIYGLWDPRGNDPMRPAAAAQLIGRGLHGTYEPGGVALLSRPFPRAFLNYLGVRFLLARHQRHIPPPWVEETDLLGGRIWRNPEALPLFFLPAAAGGAVTLDRVEPNGFALKVASPTGGLVASSVSAARGWRLTVDGRQAPLLTINGAFLGFQVGPGIHRVRLDYRPAGWVWGLVFCGVGVLGALGWGLLSARQLRLRQRGAGS